jgi:hypothetical protein
VNYVGSKTLLDKLNIALKQVNISLQERWGILVPIANSKCSSAFKT